MTICQI